MFHALYVRYIQHKHITVSVLRMFWTRLTGTRKLEQERALFLNKDRDDRARTLLFRATRACVTAVKLQQLGPETAMWPPSALERRVLG